MKVQVFIFNYAHFQQAKKLFDDFTNLNYDTYLLNCQSKYDPVFTETDKVKKLPNIYYSGQWNETLKLITGEVILIINSDVRVTNPDRLMFNLERFYNNFNGGLYAPNLDWTPWVYNPALLKGIGYGMRIVPGTDSTIWSLSSKIAKKIGEIDLKLNYIGWGIEILAAYYCFLEEKLVIRDYSIKCLHPKSSAYDRSAADQQWRKWIESLKLNPSFWDYYNSKEKYGFGWQGNENFSHFNKMYL